MIKVMISLITFKMKSTIMLMVTMMMIMLSLRGQHKHSVVPCKDSSQKRGFGSNAIHDNTLPYNMTHYKILQYTQCNRT